METACQFCGNVAPLDPPKLTVLKGTGGDGMQEISCGAAKFGVTSFPNGQPCEVFQAQFNETCCLQQMQGNSSADASSGVNSEEDACVATNHICKASFVQQDLLALLGFAQCFSCVSCSCSCNMQNSRCLVVLPSLESQPFPAGNCVKCSKLGAMKLVASNRCNAILRQMHPQEKAQQKMCGWPQITSAKHHLCNICLPFLGLLQCFSCDSCSHNTQNSH